MAENKKKKKSNSRRAQAKKDFQTTKGLTITIIVVVLITFAFLGIWYLATGTLPFADYFKNINGSGSNSSGSQTTETTQPSGTASTPSGTTAESVGDDGIVESIIYDNFQIHFMQLGNKAAGDSIYIKAGDNDILIDGGSEGNSATVIEQYVNKYCTDGKLEYVIATHSDTDHIAAFAGNTGTKLKNFKGNSVDRTGISYYYEIGTYIDFAYRYDSENKIGVENKTQISSNYGSTTEYGKYLAAREYAISSGTNYYTVADCYNNKNGGSRSYSLGADLSMDILYNKYYFEASSDNNNHSVVTMFNYGDHHFLLTGDLEKEGEEALAAFYDSSTKEKTLPKVDLFKAGHHGSKTSSNECLLSLVEPKICVVSCCAGTAEYTPNIDEQFPTQTFINRIAKYTDRVYVTSMVEYTNNEWAYSAMNGNVIVSCDKLNVGLSSTNNLIKLKDTAWFNEIVYVVGTKNVDKKKSYDFYTKDTANAVARPRRTWPSA